MPIASKTERITTPRGLEGLATASVTAAAAVIPPPAIRALLEKAKPLEAPPPRSDSDIDVAFTFAHNYLLSTSS